MVTSPLSTVIPLRRATRARIEALQAGRTFDEVLLALLDATDPAGLLVAAPPTTRPVEPAERRSPAKQRLLARAAELAWARAESDGTVERLGPRLIAWRPPTPPREVLDVTTERARGLPS